MHSATAAQIKVSPVPKVALVLRHFARRQPLGIAGAIVCFLMILMAIAAPWMTPHDPYLVNKDTRLLPPGPSFLLGTDNLGRDVLSRTIYGATVSVIVSFLAVFLAQVFGVTIGLVSAYYGKAVDQVLQRLSDMMMSFPTLIFAMALVSVLRPSLFNIILAIGITLTPRIGRVIRSQVLSIKEVEYVTAARAVGASGLRIMTRHILPQCLATILVLVSIEIPGAIIAESSLSFLGLGVQPPTPSWGNMLSEVGREFLQVAPWIAIAPGIALSLTVLGFNLFGDALRDTLDPRLRGTTRA